jgi:hypothetical protein
MAAGDPQLPARHLRRGSFGDIFKRLVAANLLPAPLDAGYDSFDLSAVQAKVGSAASIVSFARKVATEHRGGSKAVI